MSRVPHTRKTPKNHCTQTQPPKQSKVQGQGRASAPQRKVFTKTSRPQSLDHYNVVRVQCAIPSPIIGRKDAKHDLELKNMAKRKDSAGKRMKEIYVNPMRNLVLKKKNLVRGVKTGVKKVTPDTRKEIEINNGGDIELQVGDIITDAHKMIWFWLFNGLFPTTNVLGGE